MVDILKTVFWGTRGSLPASYNQQIVRSKIYKAIEASRGVKLDTEEEINEFIDNKLPFNVKSSYGTNTSCVEIRGGDGHVLCDAGSGLRDYGNYIMKAGPKSHNHFHIFMSHLHWDHIQGFPFFTPIYIPGASIDFYSCHNDLENAIVNQQASPCFPVPFEALNADIKFNKLVPEKEYEIAGLKVMAKEQNHPGKSYGYSFKKGDKKIVYSTDYEHGKEAEGDAYPFLEFIKDADLLIFDAQYIFADAIHTKENWGHSNNLTGVELSLKSGVKHLCLFHNEPTQNDEYFDKILEDTRKYVSFNEGPQSLHVSTAYDGLEIEL